MQDWAIMVIAIVAISTFGGLATRALKQRERGAGAGVDALEGRVAQLEERVRTLEAIATDPRTSLAREIGELEEPAGR